MRQSLRITTAMKLAIGSTVLALATSVGIWLSNVLRVDSLSSLEAQYLVAMPVISTAVWLQVLAVERLGPRPFLGLLWLSAAAQAGYVAFAFQAIGWFYLPAILVTALSVARVKALSKTD